MHSIEFESVIPIEEGGELWDLIEGKERTKRTIYADCGLNPDSCGYNDRQIKDFCYRFKRKIEDPIVCGVRQDSLVGRLQNQRLVFGLQS